MKILFVSNDPTIFNSASATYIRMSAHAEAIGELHVVSPAHLGAQESHEGALHVYPIITLRFLRVRALARRAHALILVHGIEIVSAQDPFEHGLAALRAVRGTTARLHIQVHTDFLSPWFTKEGGLRAMFLNKYRQKLADKILPRAAGIRVVSERIKSSLGVRYGSRIREPSVIPIAIDMTVPQLVPFPKHAFSFALIAVSRLEPEKRIEDVLQSLVFVRLRYPMTGLILVGDGSERRALERRTRALGLTDYVLFLGTRTDAQGLMKSAQVFVQASAYEGYGRTLVEAALAGVPIVTTDVGIVGDVLKDGTSALVVPVGKPAMLASKIIQLIEDNALRQTLSLNARQDVEAHLASTGATSENIAADLERLSASV